MLTDTKEYQDLVSKISTLLNIDSKRIKGICNPLRNKKIKSVWLVSIESSKAVMIREKESKLTIIK